MRIAPIVLVAWTSIHGIPSQETLWQRVGVDKAYMIGGPSAFIGDANGDGYEEIVTGALDADPAKGSYFVVLSGKDGSTLRTIRPPKGFRYFGVPIRAGDMDSDGVVDYAIARFGFTYAYAEVRSGKSDRLIWQVRGLTNDAFGHVIAGDLDLDRDGKPDLLVGAISATRVHAFDNSGKLIRSHGIKAWRVSRAGDLDLDGHDDFLVDQGYQAPEFRGAVCVHSGRTGARIRRIAGQPFDFLGSGTIGSCGDIDADGVPDIVVSSDGGYQVHGLVRVFSGKTGKEKFAWRKAKFSEFGSQFATGADLDLDGVPDLLAYSAETHPSHPSVGGTVYWFSLREGSLVTKHYQTDLTTGTAFGHDISIGGAQPGSPFPVFICSEPRYDTGSRRSPYPPSLGRLTLYRAAPAGLRSLGRGCRGYLTKTPAMGFRDLGTRGFRLHLTSAPANANALLVLGVSSKSWRGASLPFSLSVLGLPGCNLYSSIELSLFIKAGRTGNDGGFAAVDIPIPLSTGRTPFRLNGQWLVIGPGPGISGAVSDGLTWELR